MKVFTNDIFLLLNEAIKKYEDDNGKSIAEENKESFFNDLTNSINRKVKANINADTLYKQYFIKLNSYKLPEIGYSPNYLNSLCQYVHGLEYQEKFKIAYEDENEIPEFPYKHPCFPSTPAYKITFPQEYVDLSGFTDVWIKDESYNETGIHKDRMAWEVYLHYNKIIKEEIMKGRVKLPRLSMISSGNAALSIQYILRTNGLPDLKVLVDENIDEEYITALNNSGCNVYFADLTKKHYSSADILKATNNESGSELYADGNEELKRIFYDWLSYEILNLNPDYVFVPFGTGDLYKNILNILLLELKSRKSSKRFFGSKTILTNCKFFGAAVDDKATLFRMLYTPFNSYKSDQQRAEIDFFKKSGFINKDCDVFQVTDEFGKEAMKIAEKLNIKCEFSGIAGLALFLQMKENIPLDSKILIVNTGKMNLELFKKRLE